MKLYELTNEFNNAFSEIESLNSSELIQEKLNEIQLSIKEKAINVAKYVKGLKAKQEAIDKEIERLTKLKKIISNRELWLNDYLEINMRKCGITEIDSPLFKIKFHKCPCSVSIINEESIPDAYKKVKKELVIDKVKLKEDLKLGIYVQGATLVQNEKLCIK